MVPMEDGVSVDVFDDIEHIPGHLEEMDEEAQLDWANIVMGNSDPIAKALDIMGWKIIPKDDLPNSRGGLSTRASPAVPVRTGVRIWHRWPIRSRRCRAGHKGNLGGVCRSVGQRAGRLSERCPAAHRGVAAKTDDSKPVQGHRRTLLRPPGHAFTT
jgi:hypothetical protein